MPGRHAAVYDRSLPARIENQLGRMRWRLWSLRYPILRQTGVMCLGAGAQIKIAGVGRVEVGTNVNARPDLTISTSGLLSLGDEVFLGRGTNLACFERVVIGAGTRLAERVSVHDANHVLEPLSDRAGRARDMQVEPVVIGERVWLSANVVVLPGVIIGHDTVVAAGSVVAHSLPAGVLAVGTPARVHRELAL